MGERVMTSDEEQILYHRLRLASQVAAEPFIDLLTRIERHSFWLSVWINAGQDVETRNGCADCHRMSARD